MGICSRLRDLGHGAWRSLKSHPARCPLSLPPPIVSLVPPPVQFFPPSLSPVDDTRTHTGSRCPSFGRGLWALPGTSAVKGTHGVLAWVLGSSWHCVFPTASAAMQVNMEVHGGYIRGVGRDELLANGEGPS
jgi:hypothetical protein